MSHFEDYEHGDILTSEKNYIRSLMLDATQTASLPPITELSLYGDEGKTAVKTPAGGIPNGFLLEGHGNPHEIKTYKGKQFVSMLESGIILLDLEGKMGVSGVKSGDALTFKVGAWEIATAGSGSGGGGLTEAEVIALINAQSYKKDETYTKTEADAKFAPKTLVAEGENSPEDETQNEQENTNETQSTNEAPPELEATQKKAPKAGKKLTALNSALGVFSEPVQILVQTKRANGWRCYVDFRLI